MKLRVRIILFVALPLAIASTGCAEHLSQDDYQTPPVINETYRLARGDEIQIIVYPREDLSGSYVIGRTGTILMPVLGQIEAYGKTEDELAKDISKALDERDILTPALYPVYVTVMRERFF